MYLRRTSLIVLVALSCAAAPALAADGAMPWWGWPAALFAVCFCLGVVAVPAGLGGGVLFVPIVGGLFPFHMDFVRGGGLMVALASALAATPGLLRLGLASLRLALPLALVVAASQIVGARIGLMLPERMVNLALGAIILAIVALMAKSRQMAAPQVRRPDALAAALAINGVYYDAARGEDVHWHVHRTPLAMAVFVAIGMLAGMFGLGAGWANVPALNMLMGAPLKVAAGTSSLVLATTSSGAWVYLNRGAVLPIVAVPSIIGMILGARIGVRILHAVEASAIRRLAILMLTIAGARALAKGLGIWP